MASPVLHWCQAPASLVARILLSHGAIIQRLHVCACGWLGTQAVVVDRSSQSSSRDAGEEIMVRAQSNEWPQVLIFPEATTTNGRALVSFKTGAFAPGVPVQPVVVKYPHTRMDPAWVADGMSTPLLLLRLMTQPHNQMTVRPSPPRSRSLLLSLLLLSVLAPSSQRPGQRQVRGQQQGCASFMQATPDSSADTHRMWLC